MKESEVHDIARQGAYEGSRISGKVEETHISWVILTRNFAFKIKKPLRLAFLDFSTLELRKQQCEKEFRLNSRFSGIYLGVLPVRQNDHRWVIGGPDDSPVIDYCVIMRRMAVSKRLDNVVRKGNLRERSVRALASEIASVHTRAERIFTPFNLEEARSTFNDIGPVSEFALHNIGKQFGSIVRRAMEWSDSFLERHQERIQRRIDHGLKRDVHGDLHCGNIFLYRKPVLFDGIEFNDRFRQIDVLYEIAFLCMDLERFHQKHLARILLEEYGKHFPAFQQKEDHHLFVYFKALRSNVRAKVHAMQWHQAESKAEASFQLSETWKYLSLMNEYMAGLQSPVQVPHGTP